MKYENKVNKYICDNYYIIIFYILCHNIKQFIKRRICRRRYRRNRNS